MGNLSGRRHRSLIWTARFGFADNVNYGRIITRRIHIHAVGSRDDCNDQIRRTKVPSSLFPYFLPPIRGGTFGLRARALVGCVTATHRPLRSCEQGPSDKPGPARVSHPTGRTSSLSAGTDKNRTRARLHFVQLLHPFVNGLTDPLFPRKLGHPCTAHPNTHPLPPKVKKKKEKKKKEEVIGT